MGDPILNLKPFRIAEQSNPVGADRNVHLSVLFTYKAVKHMASIKPYLVVWGDIGNELSFADREQGNLSNVWLSINCRHFSSATTNDSFLPVLISFLRIMTQGTVVHITLD